MEKRDQEQLKKRRKKNSLHNTRIAIALALPTYVVVGIVLIFPLIFSLSLIVRSWSWFNPPGERGKFVGLNNVFFLFTNSRFWNSIRVTLAFMVLSIVGEFLLGLGLGILLDKVRRGRNVLRAVSLIPVMIAPTIIGLQWTYLLSDNFGVVNYLLSKVGLPTHRWLSEPTLALLSTVLVDVWTYTPFVALLVLGGMQTIPRELYEVSQLDGASGSQQFRYITLPLLKPILALTLLIRISTIIKTFDLVYVLTGGGPARSTEILGMYLYRVAFSEGDFGVAAVITMVLLLVSVGVGMFLLNVMKGEVKVI
jgi:multiple sugar transport system permease protein